MNPLISKIQNIISSDSERTANVKRNILGSLMLKGISILVQLMLVPLTLTYLSKELYGIWLTISSIVLWLNFFDVGFSLGLKNKLAEAIAKGDFTRGKQLVSTTYAMMIIIFIPLGFVCELLIPIVDWSAMLHASTALNPVLCDAMRILIISFVLQMIFNTLGATVAAFQQTALSYSFAVIGNVISLFVIWLLTIYTHPSLINMAWTISFIPCLVLVISSLILFNGFLKDVRPSLLSFRKSLIKDIFSLGVKYFIIQIQLIVMMQATNLLIANISNPDYVTYYNIAYRYLGTSTMVFSLVMSPLWPAFTDAYTKKDFLWMRSTYSSLSKICLATIITTWIMFVIAPFVYKVWITNEVEIPWQMTFAISIYFTVLMWNSLQSNLINGIGTVKLQSYVTLVGMFCHIPFSYFLGQYIGAYGVVVSMSIITAVYAFFFTTQIRKILCGTASGIWMQ